MNNKKRVSLRTFKSYKNTRYGNSFNYGYNLRWRPGECTPTLDFVPRGLILYPGTIFCTPPHINVPQGTICSLGLYFDPAVSKIGICLTKIVFVIWCINNQSLTLWTAITFNLMRRHHRNFQMQRIFLFAVGFCANFMFSFPPNCCSTIQVSVKHFCIAKRTFHTITLLCQIGIGLLLLCRSNKQYCRNDSIQTIQHPSNRITPRKTHFGMV